MTKQEAINKVIEWAKNEVGYTPYSGKRTKYADHLDSLGDIYNGPKSGYDWCDVFVDDAFIAVFGKTKGMKMLYQDYRGLGAGCGYSANYFRRNNAFTKTPQKGAQIFYGTTGNEYHTGLVVDVDERYVYTIEGNIGGGNGRVGKKTVAKNSSTISGYGIPNWDVVATEEKIVFRKFGIDVSRHNGERYPLDKAKAEGVEFAILKGGGHDDGYYKDKAFENNYKFAKEIGMPVGCYWFSYAMNTKEAIEEAEYFYNQCLKGKQFEMPVYIDIENQRQLRIGRRALTDVIKAWCDYLEKKGFWVGIYASLSTFYDYMYDEELTKYAHWIAQYYDRCTYKGNYGMWQFTDQQYVAGINTDKNYLYVDYEKAIKDRGLNGFPKPNPAIGFTRVAGGSRYSTAIEVAKRKGNSFDCVVLTTGKDYPDALSSSYLANKKNAPILLTNDDELKAVCHFIASVTKTVYIVGGYGAVSKEAENLLKELKVIRMSGKTRYDTNLGVLKEVGIDDKLIVCSGTAFPDCISASASRLPMMIVDKKLTDDQKEWLESQTIKTIYAVGSVDSAMRSELSKYGKVEPIIESNRYGTARAVAEKFFPDSKKVIIVTGQNYPDGIIASTLTEAPILLADEGSHTQAQSYCKNKKPTKAFVIGGEGALSTKTVNWVLTR